MKRLTSIFTIVITCAITSMLVFLLLSVVLSPKPAATTASAAPLAQSAPTSSPGANAQTGCDSKRSVQVSGSALVNVTPDRATIRLGVQSNGTTTQQVQAANSAATQAVIRSVSAQGVDAKDIATDIYVIEPVYDDYSSLYIKGYRINNMVAITLRDVSKTSKVIAAALEAGANQVIGVDFYTSELRKYRDQARELAMKAAQEKAQALASAAGAESGCVLAINENSWSYYNGWWYGRGPNMSQMTQNVVQNIAPSGGAGSSAGDEPISLGMISVKAEINASFGLQ